MDTQYQDSKWNTPQVPHLYNDKTFIVYNPLMLNVLGRLSSPNCKQPQFNQLIEYLYEYLFMVSANQLISQSSVSIPTRMEGCKWEGTNLNPKRNLVTVSIARAGIIPSTIIFNRLCHIFPPERIRQDHVFMNRKTDEEGRVTGVNFSGSKISAPVSNDALFIPDPMGATGSTVEYVVQYYKEQFPKANPVFVCLNLIITPQYLEKISSLNADVRVFALRLDRGNSSKEALASKLGQLKGEESGLNENSYIVPGAGGLGELMNNALS